MMLIDTCAVIDLFKNTQSVFRTIQNWEDSLYTNTTILGELYYGALHSTNPDKHLKQIKEFLGTVSVLKPDNETALQYARIRQALAQKCKLIPANDFWIAATAIQYGLYLFTRDTHLERIENLDLMLY